MASRFLGPDPLEERIEETFALLERGRAPNRVEVSRVDIKEEPGRRGQGGRVLPGSRENEKAASYLAGEMACMANTAGGGAIIVGIADDGTRIGTSLEPGWLRYRIWELTEGKLTVAVRVAELDGCRLLVLSTHEAVEPIRHRGRIRWRVADNCVEVDPTTWYSRRLHSLGHDWSAQPSGHTFADASPIAVEIARRYLRRSNQRDAGDLADAGDEDLIRRLNLVDGSGRLTNAGSLLLVDTPDIGIDYIRRDAPGGDSTNRVRGRGPLLGQIADVEKAAADANRTLHVPLGFVVRRTRSIPTLVIREAIVNGVVHRDWHSPQPTTVEHIGDQMTVTSPGGFIGGVSVTNIITHPAVPRYRSLAEAMAALRLAEREGIGVDRMIRDMLAIGRPAPEFHEIPGPYVRVGLVGGEPDHEMISFLDATEPRASEDDVDLLLIVEHLISTGWVDARSVAPVLQRSSMESGAALNRVEAVTSSGSPIIARVHGVPADHPPAYRLSDHSRNVLAHRLRPNRTPDRRKSVILDWARSRGRVSSTEVADLCSLTVVYAGKLLASLAGNGLLAGSRPQRIGRGFHYLPLHPDAD
ncbi:MAG: DUF5635 domain-containing protein [bacterium]|nr:DUF5635 domain-containing protein [bacterium]